MRCGALGGRRRIIVNLNGKITVLPLKFKCNYMFAIKLRCIYCFALKSLSIHDFVLIYYEIPLLPLMRRLIYKTLPLT